jgi:hypothetical protein
MNTMRRYRLASVTLLLAASLLLPASSFAKGGGGFRGGGRSFGGGSRPGGFSSGRSFSTPKSLPASPSRGTFKPSGGFTTRYDSGAASAQRAQSSKSLYERANGVFGGGQTGSGERVGRVTQETLETRPAREESIFHSYRTQPVAVYHDGFNPWFWLWLMDRGQRDRDYWIYNHRDEMDQQRYQDLVHKDADLERRLHDLEDQGTPHDPSYTPPGVDQDLMYDTNRVQQAYTQNQSQHSVWGTLFGLAAIVAGIYLIFFVPMFRPGRHAW